MSSLSLNCFMKKQKQAVPDADSDESHLAFVGCYVQQRLEGGARGAVEAFRTTG